MCLSIIVTLSKTNIKIIQLLLPRRFENSACYLGVSKTMQGQKTYGAFVRSVKGSVVFCSLFTWARCLRCGHLKLRGLSAAYSHQIQFDDMAGGVFVQIMVLSKIMAEI